jgi:hypothetical protein
MKKVLNKLREDILEGKSGYVSSERELNGGSIKYKSNAVCITT